MLLDGSSLDLRDVESKIAGFLGGADKLDSSVQSACVQFEVVLTNVLSLMSRKHPLRHWCLDDLYCDSFDRSDQVATLRGTSYWLSGGEGCDRFRLDVALDKDPLLYSYKFTDNMTLPRFGGHGV